MATKKETRKEATRAITKRKQGAKGGSTRVSPVDDKVPSRGRYTGGHVPRGDETITLKKNPKTGKTTGGFTSDRPGSRRGPKGRGTVISTDTIAKNTKRDLKRVNKATDNDIAKKRAASTAKKTARKAAAKTVGKIASRAAGAAGLALTAKDVYDVAKKESAKSKSAKHRQNKPKGQMKRKSKK